MKNDRKILVAVNSLVENATNWVALVKSLGHQDALTDSLLEKIIGISQSIDTLYNDPKR